MTAQNPGSPSPSEVTASLEAHYAGEPEKLATTVSEIRRIVSAHQPDDSPSDQYPTVEHLGDSGKDGVRVTTFRPQYPLDEYLWSRVTLGPDGQNRFESSYMVFGLDGRYDVVPQEGDWLEAVTHDNSPNTSAYTQGLGAQHVLEALLNRYEPKDTRNWIVKAGSWLLSGLRTGHRS